MARFEKENLQFSKCKKLLLTHFCTSHILHIFKKTIAYSFLHYGNFSNGKLWKGKFATCEKLFLTHFLHFAYCTKFQKLVLLIFALWQIL